MNGTSCLWPVSWLEKKVTSSAGVSAHAGTPTAWLVLILSSHIACGVLGTQISFLSDILLLSFL